ncbi:MAG: DNA-directed RNA polymerase subunit omega [Vicinamibacterales bacterium]
MMDDATELQEPSEPPVPVEAPQAPAEPAVPITSRFLFVDVAALRAKQLRRGARVRFNPDQTPMPLKPERVAMEEVRQRLVPYTVPIWQRGGVVEPASQESQESQET